MINDEQVPEQSPEASPEASVEAKPATSKATHNAPHSSRKHAAKKKGKAKASSSSGKKAPAIATRTTASTGWNPWKVAAITLAILFVIIVIFKNIGPSAPTTPSGQTAPAQNEDQGAAPELADTSNDPEISLTVINDKTCGFCDASQVLSVIQQQLFPTTTVKSLDYADAEAKALVEELDIQALPAYIFDAKVAEGANYDKVAPALLQKGDKYLINPAATGAGKYLNPPSADDDPVEGNVNAPVTIIEFSDFQCPFCGKFFTETLSKIREDYIKTGKVKLVYRDYPLDFHPYAQKAAEAAECADDQNKFWQMHDKIFQNQNAITTQDLKQYAENLNLDTTAFNDCLDSGKYEEEVNKDLVDGTNVGVTGTPAFFINGIAITGAQPYESFKQVIDAELGK